MGKNYPRRQRKGDRLLAPGASKSEIMVDHAIAPFDRAARDMERKWGVERLPELVPPDMAKKFGGAIAHLNACIEQGDPDAVAAAAANCIRGLNAMDAAATAAGHTPPGTVAEYDLDGFHFGIVADAGDWTAIDRPGMQIFSMREIAIALKAQFGKPVEIVKAEFPGATVTNINPKTRTKIERELDDEIPF